VSFSPCGKFIASTSIDKSVKIWEEHEKGKYRLARISYPSADWGWAVQWLDKSKCDIELVRNEEMSMNEEVHPHPHDKSY
jgi:WD40 repeat protein